MRILAIICFVLSLALCGAGYLLKQSYTELGVADERIVVLNTQLATAQKTIEKATAVVEDVSDAQDSAEKAKKKVEDEFSQLLKDMEAKKNCPVVKKVKLENEKNEVDRTATDIADTFRVLNTASCLSDPSCKRP